MKVESESKPPDTKHDLRIQNMQQIVNKGKMTRYLTLRKVSKIQSKEENIQQDVFTNINMYMHMYDETKSNKMLSNLKVLIN